MAQQRHGRVADQVGGGVVPGDDQLEDRRQHLLRGERAVAVGGDDEVGHQVLARLGALVVEQRGQVADDRLRRGHRLGRRRPGVRGEQGAEPPAEVGPVRFRDPEQLAHHRERHRERVVRHQVDDLVTAGGQVVEQLRHDRAHPVLQPVDPSSAERRRRQPSQPGVVGRVDGEHVPGQRGPGQAFGHHLAAVGQRGVHVLGQPRVVQRRPRLVVTHDQPRRVPVGQAHQVHRAGRAHLGEQRERVVAVVVTPRAGCRNAPDAGGRSDVLIGHLS